MNRFAPLLSLPSCPLAADLDAPLAAAKSLHNRPMHPFQHSFPYPNPFPSLLFRPATRLSSLAAMDAATRIFA